MNGGNNFQDLSSSEINNRNSHKGERKGQEIKNNDESSQAGEREEIKFENKAPENLGRSLYKLRRTRSVRRKLTFVEQGEPEYASSTTQTEIFVDIPPLIPDSWEESSSTLSASILGLQNEEKKEENLKTIYCSAKNYIEENQQSRLRIEGNQQARLTIEKNQSRFSWLFDQLDIIHQIRCICFKCDEYPDSLLDIALKANDDFFITFFVKKFFDYQGNIPKTLNITLEKEITSVLTHAFLSVISQGQLGILKRFFEFGLNKINDNAFKPVIRGVRFGNREIVERLLDKGFNPTEIETLAGGEVTTPLKEAVLLAKDSIPIIKLLVEDHKVEVSPAILQCVKDRELSAEKYWILKYFYVWFREQKSSEDMPMVSIEELLQNSIFDEITFRDFQQFLAENSDLSAKIPEEKLQSMRQKTEKRGEKGKQKIESDHEEMEIKESVRQEIRKPVEKGKQKIESDKGEIKKSIASQHIEKPTKKDKKKIESDDEEDQESLENQNLTNEKDKEVHTSIFGEGTISSLVLANYDYGNKFDEEGKILAQENPKSYLQERGKGSCRETLNMGGLANLLLNAPPQLRHLDLNNFSFPGEMDWQTIKELIPPHIQSITFHLEYTDIQRDISLFLSDRFKKQETSPAIFSSASSNTSINTSIPSTTARREKIVLEQLGAAIGLAQGKVLDLRDFDLSLITKDGWSGVKLALELMSVKGILFPENFTNEIEEFELTNYCSEPQLIPEQLLSPVLDPNNLAENLKLLWKSPEKTSEPPSGEAIKELEKKLKSGLHTLATISIKNSQLIRLKSLFENFQPMVFREYLCFKDENPKQNYLLITAIKADIKTLIKISMVEFFLKKLHEEQDIQSHVLHKEMNDMLRDSFLIAISRTNLDILKLFFRWELHKIKNDDFTPVTHAVNTGHVKVVRALLNNGFNAAEVDKLSDDNEREEEQQATPLSQAVELPKDATPMIKCLVEHERGVRIGSAILQHAKNHASPQQKYWILKYFYTLEEKYWLPGEDKQSISLDDLAVAVVEVTEDNDRAFQDFQNFLENRKSNTTGQEELKRINEILLKLRIEKNKSKEKQKVDDEDEDEEESEKEKVNEDERKDKQSDREIQINQDDEKYEQESLNTSELNDGDTDALYLSDNELFEEEVKSYLRKRTSYWKDLAERRKSTSEARVNSTHNRGLESGIFGNKGGPPIPSKSNENFRGLGNSIMENYKPEQSPRAWSMQDLVNLLYENPDEKNVKVYCGFLWTSENKKYLKQVIPENIESIQFEGRVPENWQKEINDFLKNRKDNPSSCSSATASSPSPSPSSSSSPLGVTIWSSASITSTTTSRKEFTIEELQTQIAIDESMGLDELDLSNFNLAPVSSDGWSSLKDMLEGYPIKYIKFPDGFTPEQIKKFKLQEYVKNSNIKNSM